MQSLTYDTKRSSATECAQRNLLVLWQNPVERAYLVVGRLGYDGSEYTFGYTESSVAAFQQGFRGLPGLRDPALRYVSDALFPVFAQRTLDPTRPDYAGYLDSLGLDEQATPFEQIVHSGGHRAADTLQLIEQPRLEANRLAATFLLNGVRHVPRRPLIFHEGSVEVTGAEHERALASLSPGCGLAYRHESGNEKNPEAIALTSLHGVPLGYVPNVFAGGIHDLIRRGSPIKFSVRAANGPDAPSHLRVVVDFEAGPVDRNPFDQSDWNFRS